MEFLERGIPLILCGSCHGFLLIRFSCYSGEKASTKEWPGFLEIKGRVRLDAFEKFLQELPMSRSRATMVSQVLPLFTIVIELLVPVLCCCSVNSCPLLIRCRPFPFIVNGILSRIMRVYICFSVNVRRNMMEEDEYFFFLNERVLSFKDVSAHHSFPEIVVANENQMETNSLIL